MPTEMPSTPERLVTAMIDALQRRALHGVGPTELLKIAQAPKGVLYHLFPGAKTELSSAAIDKVVSSIDAGLQRLLLRQANPLDGLRQWLSQAGQQP